MKKNFIAFVSAILVVASFEIPASAATITNSSVTIASVSATSTVPSKTPGGLSAGTEQVSGIGSIKKQIYAAGGDDISVAVAMLESKGMNQSDDTKSGDAANYTIFNMNWYAIRVKLYPSLGPNDAYKVKSQFTGSISNQTKTFMKYKSSWGSNFYKIHRGGQSALTGGYATEVAQYKDAIQFIANQLSKNPSFKSDNTRVWVDVPYI